jgi:hypothetical protein
VKKIATVWRNSGRKLSNMRRWDDSFYDVLHDS